MALPNGINCAGPAPSLPGGQFLVSNVPIGSIALASMGTNTAGVIQLWVSEIFIPCNRFVTKVGFLQGGTAGTDKAAATIYDSQGVLIASSAVAGTNLNGSANSFLELTISLDGAGATIGGVNLYGPGQYYIGIQLNGTAAGDIQTIAAPYLLCAGLVAAGVFGTFPSTITVPTTFTAAKGTFCYVK